MTTVVPHTEIELKNHRDDDGKNGKKKKEENEKLPMVGVMEVFRFSDWKDRIMIFVGSLGAIANGAAIPCMMVVFGDMIDMFTDTGKLQYPNFLGSIAAFLNHSKLTEKDIFKDITILPKICHNITVFYSNKKFNGSISCPNFNIEEGITERMSTFAIYYCIIGGGVLIMGYLQVALWLTAVEHQAHRIRQELFRNVMRQDIGWFDTHEAAEISTRLAVDISQIQDGIGDKVGTFVQSASTFIFGFVIGFLKSWKLTLVILTMTPFLVGAIAVVSKLGASMTSKELEAYAKAGGVAEEVFGGLKTVVAFGGQEKEALRYSVNLVKARKFGIRKGLLNGACLGFIYLAMFCCIGLGFWYGGNQVFDGELSIGNMITTFFCVMTASFALGGTSPSIQSFAAARGAANIVFQLIDLKSAIDSSSEEGLRPSSITGAIQFKDIHFCYPSRPAVKILKGVSLEARPGQTVALVGASGCGKSTSVALLLRFYDPLRGQVLLDGVDVKDLNIKWLRKHIGLVSQEPVLFATTIAENIKYGKEGVTMDEIIKASKNANIYDFIMELPAKFDTMVGERGAQLSGGQKQRIAIARALVSDPKILLLDEATSALDTESESIVQDALDKARKGRTTLVIAHRLSTIKTADIIVGFNKGVVAEKGTHDELMLTKGIYYQLVTSQSQVETKKEEQIDEGATLTQENKPHNRGPSTTRAKSGLTFAKVQRHLSVSFSHEGFSTSVKLQQRRDTLEEIIADENEDETLPNAPFTRLMKMNAPEWYFIILGCFGAGVNGGVQPLFAVVFSEFLSIFVESKDEQERKIEMYSWMFVGIGIINFYTNILQGYMFGLSGEALTSRLRDRTFRSMLRQDVSWFDNPKNSVGALTTRLATDASLVQGVTGAKLGTAFMSVANIGVAVIIAFIYGWKLAILILAFLPFLLLGGLMQVKLLSGQAGKHDEALENAGKVAVESIENIRTVAPLAKEGAFFKLYMETLKTPYKQALKGAHLVGLTYSFSQSIIYFAYAAAFKFGAYLVEQKEMKFDDVFLVVSAIVFGATSLGNAAAFAPDFGKAQISAKRIIYLIDSKPTLDYTSTNGNTLPANYKAEVSFKSVHFRYPNRITVPVLQGLTCTVSPGQTLALVGSSGCGKSTSIQLIERFYDTDDGSVCLANNDVRTLNLQWLRAQLGLVSQEPILFDCSISDNIAYGDNSRKVGMEEIIQAAREANIHSFITSLPDGYSTNAGSKGTQLSGGQKQRIAIARALVRNPKVLLLDEATSALDTESEKIVQEALDKARAGRTCVVIAHRLSTIKNADKICVVSHGKIAETGTHNELMAKQGFYYKLVKNSVRA